MNTLEQQWEFSMTQHSEQQARTRRGLWVHMEIKLQSTRLRSCNRGSGFSQSRGKEDKKSREEEGGETRLHSFQRKEVFSGGMGQKPSVWLRVSPWEICSTYALTELLSLCLDWSSELVGRRRLPTNSKPKKNNLTLPICQEDEQFHNISKKYNIQLTVKTTFNLQFHYQEEVWSKPCLVTPKFHSLRHRARLTGKSHGFGNTPAMSPHGEGASLCSQWSQASLPLVNAFMSYQRVSVQ